MPGNHRSSIAFQEQCLRASGKPFEAKINAGVISHLEDRLTGWVIMIEELLRRLIPTDAATDLWPVGLLCGCWRRVLTARWYEVYPFRTPASAANQP